MSDTDHTHSIAVVIPVYNRLDVLRRTLASLEAQTHPDNVMQVIVADDGSEEDIGSLVQEWLPPFRSDYLRQDRNGFGAGRARNLGASASEAEILIFLDSDGIVAPDFSARHAAWHQSNRDAVVIGGRVNLEARSMTTQDLGAGRVDLENAGWIDRRDFRDVLSRRTAGYRSTDEAYRAFVSSNVSMPRALFEEVGGFDPRFRWWGSEDTEFGWRLWQAGALFIDDSDNRIYHQLELDTAGGTQGRDEARRLNRGLLSSLVPHRFYRKGMPDPLPEAPKVSVLVHDIPAGAPREIWRSLTSQTLPDFEVIFVAPAQDHDPFAGAAEGDPRVQFVPEPDSAVAATRGEYVVFVDGHAALSPTLIQNVRKRLDQRPAAVSMRFGIDIPGEVALTRLSDVADLERAWGVSLPMATAVRRRHLSKELRAGQTLDQTLSNLALHPQLNTTNALVALPGWERVSRPEGFSLGKGPAKQVWEEAQLGPAQAFKATTRVVKERLKPPRPAPAPKRSLAQSNSPGIRYVGWVGKDNLGDEAMLEATQTLLSWGEVSARGEARDLLLLGGGTLINRNQYLGWLIEHDSPRIERAVFGTGVASPDYWGLTEDKDAWLRWLGTCSYVGVRGPKSAETLESWGYKGDLEICGDPALALEAPSVEPVAGKVLIAPAWTNGESWGEDDVAVYSSLAESAAAWIDDGREVVLMSCHPSDDRPIIQIREQLGARPSTYLAGYLDVKESLNEIAAASVVVGERLHACVLAATAGRPFAAIEYRPKVRDFALSVQMEESTVRSDLLQTAWLVETVDALHAAPQSMTEAVAAYRDKLASAATIIRESTLT